jgi:pimeloyl-ACP methyl ester carboxylesterase
VPVDYRSPHGRTLHIVVSRIATAKPGLRRGVLVVNLGGPGDVGVDAPSFLVPLMPPELLDRYDIVGFDPRGVRYSAGISCRYRTDVPGDLHERYPALDGSIE